MGLVERYPALNRPIAPVCSVCIANYNGALLLDDCLSSVLQQQGNISVEIIVHDDASTDDSVALLREKYPQVEVLASTENVGFCISNNRMVDHARGEFVLLLNNDAALYPDALATLFDMARSQPSAGILTLPQYDWETGELVDRGCLLDPFYNPVPNLDVECRDVAMAIGACLWLPRDLWIRLGGFPEWMESIGEDIFLCCLAKSRRSYVRTASRSGFRHRLGASFGGARVENRRLNTTVRRRRLSERNKTFVLVIFTPAIFLWPLLTVHLAALLVEGVALGLVRRDRRVFSGIYGAALLALWRNRSLLRDVRREVQSSRTSSIREFYASFSIWPRKLALLGHFGVPRLGE